MGKFKGKFDEKPYKGKAGSDYGELMDTKDYCSQPLPYATFAAMITRLDQQVGEIVAKLKELGLDRNTIIFFSSDNGLHHEGGANPDFFKSHGPFRGVKRDLYEGEIRLPLIAWALGTVRAGVKCPISGVIIPLENPDKINTVKTFSDFFEWYKRELAVFTDWSIQAVNLIDRDIFHQRPYPFLSATMDGCLESGKDVTNGGTVYNLSSVNSCGMADTVDSLVSLKKLVFEEKTITLQDFVTMLRQNFANSPVLLSRLEHEIPKYGNDNKEIDELMAALADGFCKEVNSHSNPRGGSFQTGLYTVDNHAKLGKLTGALPNGRLEKISLANAIAPCQGADVSGPTAVINSVTQINHAQCGNGIVFDLKFHPRFFKDSSRRLAFRSMVETYFDLGGMQVQFNIFDKKTLLHAQLEPDMYKDLIVRVSGFSAYFTNLDRVLQNEIIARTDQAEYA